MNKLILLPIASLWLALVALTYILFRLVGWAKLRQYSFALFILFVALLGLPGAGFLKVAMPYKDRILARLIRKKSPPVVLTSGCSVLPENNIWNTRIAGLPVDPRSLAYIEVMGPHTSLHADFSIPYGVVSGNAPVSQVAFSEGAGESDPGPYRIPDDAPIEPGSDAHVLVLDQGACRLYELYGASHTGAQQWQASSGAIFDLRSNRLRPAGWTSADAAGLPIFPGLVRYEEVKSGAIRHALRFTTRATRREFAWPARHFASRSSDPNLPPMGMRFRLRSSFDISGYAPETQVILTALKEYGMFLADNGGPWYLTGASDSRWSSKIYSDFRNVFGSDFEAVDTSSLMVDRDSGEARR